MNNNLKILVSMKGISFNILKHGCRKTFYNMGAGRHFTHLITSNIHAQSLHRVTPLLPPSTTPTPTCAGLKCLLLLLAGCANCSIYVKNLTCLTFDYQLCKKKVKVMIVIVMIVALMMMTMVVMIIADDDDDDNGGSGDGR